MVSIVSSLVDPGFIGGVMVSIVSSLVDPGFISGVMVSIVSSLVDPGFKRRSGQTKDYKIS
jgi:hypothetical protein